MAEGLDDLLGLPVTPGAVDVLEGSQCAPGDALGRQHHNLESPADGACYSKRLATMLKRNLRFKVLGLETCLCLVMLSCHASRYTEGG